MNDFTIEELERLKNAHYWQQYENIMPCDAVLQIKLQSLIDSYCDHERLSPTEALNIPLHCLDCGENIE